MDLAECKRLFVDGAFDEVDNAVTWVFAEVDRLTAENEKWYKRGNEFKEAWRELRDENATARADGYSDGMLAAAGIAESAQCHAGIDMTTVNYITDNIRAASALPEAP